MYLKLYNGSALNGAGFFNIVLVRNGVDRGRAVPGSAGSDGAFAGGDAARQEGGIPWKTALQEWASFSWEIFFPILSSFFALLF